jgi:23S rRNA pseudouridine1911/1915/1917 synthase
MVRRLAPPKRPLTVVDVHAAGSLLAALERAFPAVRPTLLRARLAAGDVAINGEPCLADRRVRPVDLVTLAGERPSPPVVVPAPPPVLWESAAAIVVHKPPGLSTVPERSGAAASLHGLLPTLRPGADLRIVHRLDRDTSGCLLLAKGLAAAQHFDRAFQSSAVAKTYLALVHGAPAAAAFAIDAWLGPDRRRPGKVVAAARQQPQFRAAHTAVTVVQRYRQHALLTLQPTTGRSHQLRVHLQSVGHPIVGDLDYGGAPLLLSTLKPGYKLRPGADERPLLRRLFLHAQRLSFQDLDGAAVDVEASLPDDLAVALRQLDQLALPKHRSCD